MTNADPTMTKLDLGFRLFAVFFFTWVFVDSKRFIKFFCWWAKPPYTPRLAIAFRILFGLFLAGAVDGFVERFSEQPHTKDFVLSITFIASLWLAAAIVMVKFVEWMNSRREGHRRPGPDH